VDELEELGRFVADEHGLVVVSTARPDGSVLSSVVNAGVMPHPIDGGPVVAFVSRGGAARLAHIRAGAPVTVTVRRGWAWHGVTGHAALIGPDDPNPAVDAERLRMLLRAVFAAAGGTHDDWDTYDRVMADERRVAVFVHPERLTGNH
jgi:PPOX class probable F420-dependent enzyme